MKKILFIIAFLFTVFANAQGGPKVDVVKFRGEVTTTVRNTFDVPTGERWLIWNTTTEQFEHSGSDDVWSALDTTIADDQNATEVNIIDSGGNYTGTTVEAALAEIALEFTSQSDDQNATEVNIIDSGGNYTGTTVEAALAEVSDSIAVKANLTDVVNWNPVPSGGSNKIITNTADEIKASNITASSSGGVDFISSLGTIGLTPTDSPPFNSKGWIYMGDSESKLKVSNGVSFKNLAYEDDIVDNSLSEADQSITTNRSVNLGITAQLTFFNNSGTDIFFMQGSAVRPTFPENILVPLTPIQPDDAASKSYVDSQVSGASHPSTAQQYYIVSTGVKDIASDADYAAAANYKSLMYKFTANDTLLVGDGVTFATHGHKPMMVQPTTADSVYIKKADGVDFFVAGQKAAITGDGLIVKNRNTAVGYKESADAWYWSGDLTVHTEPDTTPPSVPTNLTNIEQGGSYLDYSFTASTDNIAVSGYEYELDNSGSPVDIGNVTLFRVSGLTASTLYNVKIRAYDAAGNRSAYTANVSGTTTGVDSYPTGNFASTDDVAAFGSWLDQTTSLIVSSNDQLDNNAYRAIGRSGSGFSTFHRADLSGVFDGTSSYTLKIRASQVQGTNSAFQLKLEGSSTNFTDLTSGSTLENINDTPGFNEYTWTIDSSLNGVTGIRLIVTTTSTTTGNDDGVVDTGESVVDISKIEIIKN